MRKTPVLIGKTDVQTAFSDQSINPFPINHGFRPTFWRSLRKRHVTKKHTFSGQTTMQAGCCWNCCQTLAWPRFSGDFFRSRFFDWVKDRLFSVGLIIFAYKIRVVDILTFQGVFVLVENSHTNKTFHRLFLNPNLQISQTSSSKLRDQKKTPKIGPTVVLKDGSPILYLAILRSCSFWDG